VTRLGVTGHCDLTARTVTLVDATLRRQLSAYAGGSLIGISCLAPGTDQIFARMVLQMGGRLEVVLPAPDYRECQIGPEHTTEFDELLAAARTVRLTGFERSCRQAYAAANGMMLSSIDCLFAVWDGRGPARLGSTGGVVAAAHQLGIPSRIIWPATAARTCASSPSPARPLTVPRLPSGRPGWG
jgi:hypothetical protein